MPLEDFSAIGTYKKYKISNSYLLLCILVEILYLSSYRVVGYY